MNTCVIIPTYNEEKTIGDIIERIKDQGLSVLIIDDGSTDNTAQIAKEKSAILIRNSHNQGKGAALIKGYDYIKRNAFDSVITMDGDGQHLPEDIPNFLETARRSQYEFFIGNRMLKPHGMPLLRQLTNRVMSWFISLIIGQKISDTQCGFRLIKRSLLEKINFTTHRFETETEILLKSGKLGYRIISIPVRTVYLHEKSQINPLVDTIRFVRFVFREVINKKGS